MAFGLTNRPHLRHPAIDTLPYSAPVLGFQAYVKRDGWKLIKHYLHVASNFNPVGALMDGPMMFKADGTGAMYFPQAPISTCPALPNITRPEGLTGQEVFVQTFFKGPPTCKCCKNWVEYEPEEATPEIRQKYVGAAIIQYRCKDPTTSTRVGGLRRYKVEWMDVLSPLIRKEIKPLLAGLGYDFPNDAMTVHAPFQALFFGQARISDRFKQLEEGCEEKQHLKLLVDVMKDLFIDLAPRVNDFLRKGIIDGAYLWALFPKGQIVYSRHLGHDQAFQVQQLKERNLWCRHVAFDGSAFGWAYATISIREFTGTRSINELEVYPIAFHPRHEELKAELIQRGRKSLDYQGICFLDYEGQAEGRRMIVNEDYDDYEDEGYGPETLHIKTKYADEIAIPVSVSIDGLSPTSWVDNAFDQLVLPESTKDLVLTFVESHKTTQALGSDFVAGKGRGLVFLLCGPTGTGKTLTVESVSDKVRRPLYHLQAGEMGSKPVSLKSSLQKAFRLCEEWDGVLLVDVLLATLEYYSGIIFMTTNILAGRDPAIVSRLDIHLEYSCLDFPTRLQLWRNLLLPPPSILPQPSPAETDDSDVTMTPADAAAVPGHHGLTEADLLDLASWNVNGRDIKHAVKNARKWCYTKGKPVTLDALQTGLITTAPRSKREENEESNFDGGKKRRIE
ncbi:ATP-dependent zinc metalloprotease FtsH [Apiospora aurea]|uniref:ATP-dependent zinc metalloprotease FtsH n=1 Tax=Apiospora aurea TaxID=335848 RepID=A0ABR1Q5P5_9PEZI